MEFGKNNTGCIKTMYEELEVPCFQNKSDAPHLAHFLVDVTADSPPSKEIPQLQGNTLRPTA